MPRPRPTLRDRVRELLAPGGRVASSWFQYEERPGQRALAEEIAETLENGGVLLAEAPTGIGKSLAYLLPGVLLAAETDRRVVVATCTRSLQDQLVERDIPALLASLETHVPFVRLKGKQNYVCPRALELVAGNGAEEEDTLDELRAWAAADVEGDLDRFPAADADAFRRLRPRVGTDPEACSLVTCRRGRECFWVRARRRAAEARLVVVNHALLGLSADVEGLLPDYDALVVDEAHRLEGVLLAQLERSVSRNRFEELLRLLGSPRRGRRGTAGLTGRARAFALPLLGAQGRERWEEFEAASSAADACRADVGRLFERLEPGGPRHELYGLRERYRSAGEILGSDLGPLEGVLGHCGRFARALHYLGAEVEAASGGAAALELSAELEQVSARWSGLGADLLELCEASRRDWVYWRTAAGRGVELHGAPVSAGDHARRLVLGRARAAVLTSATLSAAGDFSFTAERLGLGETRGAPFVAASHPSPFPLARQMLAYIYDAGPGVDEAAAVADLVAELAVTTRRNQLVLFTAHERLRRARERLLERLPATTPMFAQEWDGAVSQIAERFRGRRGAVLLGVQSLWEGVDFPGEELEIVVVAKLPFSVPDDPRVEARGERLREQGLDPFRSDAVPEAVLRFRQGIGRLIRRADDRGVLVVCDPRLLTASYRRPFLEALPVAPTLARAPRELAREAARFLGGEAGGEKPT